MLDFLDFIWYPYGMEIEKDEQCQDDGSLPRLYAAFQLLQEKWIWYIIHSLLPGPLGFNELSRRAHKINSTTLAQRLALLERTGIITKTVQSTMPPRSSYELTTAGRALEPIIEGIATWSDQFMTEQIFDKLND